MTEKITVALLQNDTFCRTCLSSKNLVVTRDPKLIEFYASLLSESDRNLKSSAFCDTCFQLLQKFYNFKRMCAKARETIHDVFPHERDSHPYNSVAVEVFRCDLCAEKVLSRHSFVKHMKKKHERPHFSLVHCADCNGTFFYEHPGLADNFASHVLESHTDIRDKKFHCKTCNLTRCNQAFLIKHFKSKHARFSHPNDCPQCSATFTSIKEYELHLRHHLPKFECDFCGSQTIHKNEIFRHIKLLHMQEGHKCSKCGANFISAGKLTKHLQKCPQDSQPQDPRTTFSKRTLPQGSFETHPHQRHLNTKVACTICGKQVGPAKLSRHIKVVHSYSKEFVCDICNRSFNLKFSLRKHLHQHAKSRPHNCHLCTKGYYSNALLARHIQRAHR